MIRLSSGRKLTRRFLKSDKLKVLTLPHLIDIQALFDFVFSEEENEEFDLATHYPKRIFSDPSLTFEEAGMFPKATLFVDDKI